MNQLRKLFGLHPMNEAPADGAPAGGGDAPAAPAAPDAAPAADVPAATEQPTSLLTGEQPNPEAEKPAEAPGAPEAYEPFKAPEAMADIELDAEATQELGSLFKELGLPQDKAQAAFEKLLGIQQKLAGTPEQQQAAIAQNVQALSKQWEAECRALPEIGGANFDESLKAAHSVMTRFGDEGIKEMLAYSGLGSNPQFFKMMVNIGRAMADDTIVHGGALGNGPKSVAERLWPGSN